MKRLTVLIALVLAISTFGCSKPVGNQAHVLFFDWSRDKSVHYVASGIQTLPLTNEEPAPFGSFWGPKTSPNGKWAVNIDWRADGVYTFRLHLYSLQDKGEKIIPIPKSISKISMSPNISFDGDTIYMEVEWGEKGTLYVDIYRVDPTAVNPFVQIKEITVDEKYEVYSDNCGLPWQDKIVFYEPADPYKYQYQIRITPNLLYDVKTGTTSVVNEVGDDWSICSRWSPDMKSSIYMTRLVNPNRLCWILNTDNRDTELACFPRHVDDNSGLFSGWQFLMGNGVWSPDGRYFALVAQKSQTQHDVLIYDKTGRLVTEAVNVGEMPESGLGVLHWSPDSTQIAFVAQFGAPGVYTLDLSGKVGTVYTSPSCLTGSAAKFAGTQSDCDVAGWLK